MYEATRTPSISITRRAMLLLYLNINVFQNAIIYVLYKDIRNSIAESFSFVYINIYVYVMYVDVDKLERYANFYLISLYSTVRF